MAKKRKRKSTPKTKSKRSKNQRILQARTKKQSTPLLRQAAHLLKQRKLDRALQVARDALKFASTQLEKQQAHQVMAEAHFRAAMLGEVNKQLPKLKQALSFMPNDPRIRFYHAIALWRHGHLAEALKELEVVAQREPNRPSIHFLLQLAYLANGKSWSTSRLNPNEIDTLRTIDTILSRRRTSKTTASLPATNADIWKPLLAMYTGHQSPVEPLQAIATQSENASIKSVLHYYEGVAAMRKGDKDHAQVAWSQAQKTGVTTAWLNDNLAYRLRERANELAKEEKWIEITKLTTLTKGELQDRILSETIGLAYFHLGYNQAQEKKWARAAHYWRKAEEWAGNRHIAQNLALAEEAVENWSNAATAWRDMIRRRPRSKKSPDYLTDNQVAGIWQHLAECYRNMDDFDEVMNSLRNAIKYDSQNIEVRMDLARVCYANDHEEAARRQFDAILEIEPNHIEALLPLAHIHLENAWGDSIPLWKRILEIEPQHGDARDGLAKAYLKKMSRSSWLGKHALNKMVEEALQEQPNHPLLLVGIAEKYQFLRDYRRSLEFYLRAYQAGPQNVKVVDQVMENLLDVGGERELEAMIPEVSKIDSLLPGFWLDLARKALRNEDDPKWIKLYLEETVKLAERDYVKESKATLFMRAYELIERVAPPSLCRYFAQRIRQEVPHSGAIEFVKACEALERGDERNAKRWFNKAKRNARRVKDSTALEFIEKMEMINFSMPDLDGLRAGFLAHLLNMLPDGELDDFFDFD